MPSISEIADRYVREYSFMAVNATRENAIMLHSVHADDATLDELHQVHDELLVATKEEYDDGVKEHGVPPAFADHGVEQGLRVLGTN